MAEKFSDYCHPASQIDVEMVKTAEDVSLQVITFTPQTPNNNPAVIFVAGWVSLIQGWGKVLKELTKDFKVYYVETREKKSSEASKTAKMDVDSIGRDITQLVTYFNLNDEEFIMLGSSLGATSIIDGYQHLKKHPRAIVLIGPNGIFKIPRYGRVLIKLFYPPLYIWFKPYLKWYLKTFRLNVSKDYAQYEKYCNALDAADPWKLKKAAGTLSNYAIWPLLEKIDCPTLLIGASHDKLHEPGNLKHFVELLPDVTLLDMGTNEGTHSAEMVVELRKYLSSLKGK